MDDFEIEIPPVRIQSKDLEVLPELASVAAIEIQVDPEAFSTSSEQDHPPWKCVYDAEELDRLEISKRLWRDGRNLRRISITDGGCYQADTDGELTTWRNNLSMLENVLQLRIDLRHKLPHQTPLFDSPEPSASRCNDMQSTARQDSIQFPGLPMYAPESKYEVFVWKNGSEGHHAAQNQSLRSFLTDCYHVEGVTPDHERQSHSLRTLLWRTGVLRANFAA